MKKCIKWLSEVQLNTSSHNHSLKPLAFLVYDWNNQETLSKL